MSKWFNLADSTAPPSLVQGASNSAPAPASCSDNAQFWLFVFFLFAVGSFIFQEYCFSRERWKLPEIHLDNKTLLEIFFAALGIALAFLSFVQMLPYWMNASLYIVAFLVMVRAAMMANLRWTGFGRFCAVLGGAVYLVFWGIATVRQYQNQHNLDIVFKTSVSEYRQFITKNDLSEFRDYFHNLDVPTPVDGPTIGIEKNGNCASWINPQKHQTVLRPEIFIGEKCLTRQEMTMHYSDVVIEHLPHNKNVDNDIHHLLSFMIAQDSFSSYFNWSFWDKRIEPFCPGNSPMAMYGAPTLWKIRQKVGKGFTDRLAAYATRITADDPMDGMDQDPRTYFARKLKAGDDVVDDGTNWPTILGILKEDGFKIQNI
jgi:hypothetical protein